jgi:predicted phage terminase large subunit-like protein
MQIVPPFNVGAFDALDPARQRVVLDRVENLRQQAHEKRERALEDLRLLELELMRRKCKKLRFFVEHFWPLVEPDKPFASNWHIEELCKLLEEVSDGRHDRVLINVPPGTMKSLLVSVFWPAWEWGWKPHLRYIAASYGGHLSIRDNLRLRMIVSSPRYSKLFPNFAFMGDQNAKERFNTTAGGWRIATSVGGVGTGEHPDRFIIDDPHSAAQAASDVERQSALDWFDRTVSTRGITRGVVIIVIMQRLHEQDLSGHLLQRGGWLHVCFPMKYETTRRNDPTWKPDPRDPRRTPGTLLWPTLFPELIVRNLEINLGPYGTAGQLQQRPAPEGGGLFKREWFKIVDALPVHIKRRCRGWDTASTENAGDYTVGVKIDEMYDSTFVVENVVRGQLSPAAIDAVMRQTTEMDGRACCQREEKEGGSSGKAVIAARTRLLRGFDYGGVHVGTDKVTRSMPFRAQCEAGNVALLRGDWNEQYLAELSAFPTGTHDDQVDGSSAAFNALMGLTTPILRRATWGR